MEIKRITTDIVKNYNAYINDKIEMYVIVTYTIGNEDLRKKLENLLVKYELEKEEDQSTYKGEIKRKKFENFVEDIKKSIVDSDDFSKDSDFVSVYYSDTEINQRVLR